MMLDQLVLFVQQPLVMKLLTVLVLGLLTLSLSRFIRKRSIRFIKDTDSRYHFKKITGFFTYLILILIISIVFADRLGGLTVALGVAGAGIAFALQEVIISVAGWLVISFSGIYRIGDRVQLGNVTGDVIDIGMLRTTLMECRGWVNGDQYNGLIVRVGNSQIFKDPVRNYSGDFPFLWDEIVVPIRYGSDVAKARDILEKVADESLSQYAGVAKQEWQVLVDKYRIENAMVEPQIYLIANDNWIELTLRYVVDYKQRRMTKDTLFSSILAEVEQSGGAILLASATYELTAMPEINVSLQSKS